MNGQTYLLLVRDGLPDNWTNPMEVSKFLRSMIRGDSLDVPFINFIKCHEFSHSIGDGAGKTHDQTGLFQNTLPGHDAVHFQKSLDAASPQLSFGCSVSEKFPFAVFFFRRKTTFNIGGVVHPHTVIGYRNCKVSRWETDGNTESVELTYDAMGMAAFTQIADSKIPQGASWRTWNTVSGSGGMLPAKKMPTKDALESYWGSALIPATLAIIGVGSLIANAAGPPKSFLD
jgi:type VI protein secretion system component Hcp